jgi:hypothetical protein
MIPPHAGTVLDTMLDHICTTEPSELCLWSVICPPRPSSIWPVGDAAQLHAELSARNLPLRIIRAHGWVRELLRAGGMAKKPRG